MSNERHIIELVDKYSDPMAKAASSTERFEGRVNRMSRAFNDQGRNINQLRERMERYKRLRDESFRTDHIRRYNLMIAETQRRIHGLSGETDRLAGKTRNWQAMAMRAVGAYAGIQGLRMLGRGVMSNINAYGEIERYSATLETMLGSRGAARDRMEEYMQIAATTPFQVSEVVESGNKLQAIGRYSPENLRMLGDLSAAAGKPIQQALNAYSKLAMGERGEAMNMFRDLLISPDDFAAATGTQKDKQGRLTATPEQMLEALPEIMRSKNFLGMMARQAETTEGKISNFNDSLFQLRSALGERMAPAFKQYLEGATRIVAATRSWVEIPLERKLQDEVTLIGRLHTELLSANTTEERRLSILEELARINPEITEGIDAQAINYDKLAKNIQRSVDALKERIFWERNQEKISVLEDRVGIDEGRRQQALERVYEIIARNNVQLQPGYNIEDEIDNMISSGAVSGRDASMLREAYGLYQGYNRLVPKREAALYEMQSELDQIANALFPNRAGRDRGPSGGSSGSTGTGTGSPGGATTDELARNVNQLSGSPGSVRNVTINIGSMIETNQNIFEHAEANPEDFTEKLKAALISVLNDVNYMN